MKKKTPFVVVLIVLILITVLPIYPIGKVGNSYPTDINDPRINAQIDKKDLDYINSVIRKKKWGYLYALALGLAEDRKIIKIEELYDVGTKDPMIFDNSKKVIDVTTTTDNEMKRDRGVTYSFKRVNGALKLESTTICLINVYGIKE